jgi:hypothetical protein
VLCLGSSTESLTLYAAPTQREVAHNCKKQKQKLLTTKKRAGKMREISSWRYKKNRTHKNMNYGKIFQNQQIMSEICQASTNHDRNHGTTITT